LNQAGLYNSAAVRLFPAFLLAGFALTGFSCQSEKTLPGQRTFGEPTLSAKLDSQEINESSGVARSHGTPGEYLTHNDSGDTARFWRFDLHGKTTGPFNVPEANAIDWEDMATVRVGNANFVYLADIGDNAEKRKSVQIYVVTEPKDAGSTSKPVVFNFDYPDGPHNAETLLVNPKDSRMAIVTKTSKGPSLIFWAPLGRRYLYRSNPKQIQPEHLELVGTVQVGSGIDAAKLVTGGDFSEDGKYVVLRTYLAAYEFDVPISGAWWKSKPRVIKTAPEIQGEAIAYSLDGKQLVTTSEYAPCPVSIIPINPQQAQP
jgi:hypothetical protein